jgi:hypothetical protein
MRTIAAVPSIGWRAWLPPLDHLGWFGATLVVVGVVAWIHVDVQRVRSDLARTSIQLRAAQRLQEQHRLERAALLRAVALEASARRLGMGPVPVVDAGVP